jgi:hypothetical protein
VASTAESAARAVSDNAAGGRSHLRARGRAGDPSDCAYETHRHSGSDDRAGAGADSGRCPPGWGPLAERGGQGGVILPRQKSGSDPADWARPPVLIARRDSPPEGLSHSASQSLLAPAPAFSFGSGSKRRVLKESPLLSVVIIDADLLLNLLKQVRSRRCSRNLLEHSLVYKNNLRFWRLISRCNSRRMLQIASD